MLRARKIDRRRKKKKAVPYGNINLAAGRWTEDGGRWAGHLLSFCGVQCEFLCNLCVRKWERHLQETDAAYAEYEQARQREKDDRGGKVLKNPVLFLTEKSCPLRPAKKAKKSSAAVAENQGDEGRQGQSPLFLLLSLTEKSFSLRPAKKAKESIAADIAAVKNKEEGATTVRVLFIYAASCGCNVSGLGVKRFSQGNSVSSPPTRAIGRVLGRLPLSAIA